MKPLITLGYLVAAVDALITGTPQVKRQSYEPNYRISPIDGSKIALPTAEQLAFQDKEIGILIHFNIATYLSIDGCNNVPGLVPNQTIFNPTLLSTDQWMDVAASLGAKYATLVAKHNCGFTLWPSSVSFPSRGNETLSYNYTTAQSPVHGEDIVAMFSSSAKRYQIGHGFYYSVVVNNFLNVQDSEVNATSWTPGQVNVTNSTYDQIVFDQLTELWSNYGSLTEIWFDGGYSATQMGRIETLLQTHQPQAAIFNGCDVNGTCVSPNSVRWIGTESGQAPDPNWSTGVTNDGGHEGSPYFCPAECDTTLQTDDRWFYGIDQPLRSFEEMVEVYHKTVGRNCLLELDLSPDRSGLVPARYAARYKQLGDFIRSCYSEPVAVGAPQISVDGSEYGIVFERPTAIDRIVLMEDQTNGQVVREYEVRGKVVDSSGANGTLDIPWTMLSRGTSIGHKKIDLFKDAVTVMEVKVTAKKYADVPQWREVSVHLCDRYSFSKKG